MSINHEVKVFSTVDFYENPEKTGDYLLKLEAAPYDDPRTGKDFVHVHYWSGDPEKFLQTAREILRVLAPPPSDRILKSLGRIEKLLKKLLPVPSS